MHVTVAVSGQATSPAAGVVLATIPVGTDPVLTLIEPEFYLITINAYVDGGAGVSSVDDDNIAYVNCHQPNQPLAMAMPVDKATAHPVTYRFITQAISVANGGNGAVTVKVIAAGTPATVYHATLEATMINSANDASIGGI